MMEATAMSFSVTLLVAVFLMAGMSKLRTLETFEGVVHNFRLLPEVLVRPVAYGLPLIELAVAAALLIPMIRGYAGWGAALLLGVFTLAVTINLLRGRREIDCGCFSSELRQRLGWWLVARNAILVGLALWVADGTVAAQAMGGAGLFMGIAAAVMVAALYATASTLSAIAQRVAAHRAAVEER